MIHSEQESSPKNYLKRKCKKEEVLLIVMVAIQVAFLTLVFAFCKQGYHSDELWNYGFANSHDLTHLWSEGINDEVVEHWLDSDILKDYITVDREHRFSYTSVYRNAANDLNPPLQEMFLHTVCSFFPDVFSGWFCFIVNILAFVVIQFYLYRLVKSMTQNAYAGLAACLLFGFGFGAIDLITFLRIYAVAVAFAVMFAYYSHELYRNRDTKEQRIKSLIFAGSSCLLGCFTLHLFLVYAFAIVLSYTLFYLFSGKFKLFFQYGLTSALAVLMSFVIFPSTVRHMFGGTTDTYNYSQQMYPVKWQIRLYWHFITQDLFGVSVSMWPQMTLAYVGYAVLIIAFFLAPVCFLARKETWYLNTVSWIKKKFLDICKKIKNFQFTVVTLLFTVVFLIIIAANRTSVYRMGEYSNRYVFLCYPILVALCTGVVYFIINWFVSSKRMQAKILVGIAAVFVFLSLSVGGLMTSRAYFFEHHEEGTTLADLGEDANCICLLRYAWLVTCLTSEIYETDRFYITTPLSYQYSDYEKEGELKEPLYLIIDQGFLKEYYRLFGDNELKEDTVIDYDEYLAKQNSYNDTEILAYFYSLDFVNRITYIGCDEISSREINIYRIDLKN